MIHSRRPAITIAPAPRLKAEKVRQSVRGESLEVSQRLLRTSRMFPSGRAPPPESFPAEERKDGGSAWILSYPLLLWRRLTAQPINIAEKGERHMRKPMRPSRVGFPNRFERSPFAAAPPEG